MQHPTEADWLMMAEAFDVARKQRTEEQLDMTTRYRCDRGLCRLFAKLGLSQVILTSLWPEGKYHWWGLNDKGDQQRAFFCIMMAAVTKKGDLMGMLE